MTNSKIEQVLIDNNFEICKTPEGQNNLMKSVSLALFNTIDHYEKIQQYCKKFIKHLIESKLLSKKLEGFIQNERWVADYFTNPTLKCFERLNLELLSLIFKTKITIFTISQEQQFLKSTIYNNGFDIGIINLYQPDQKHYDVVRQKNSPILPILDQALISDILGDLKDQQNGVSLKEDQSSHSYQIYGVAETPQIPAGQKRHSFHRKHKKSLSDTFNPFQIRVPNEFLDLFKGSNDFSNNSQFLSLINHHQSGTSNNNNDASNHHHHEPAHNLENNQRRLKYQNYIDEAEETLTINSTQPSKFNLKANETSSPPNSFSLTQQLNPEQPTQFSNTVNSNQLLNPEKLNEESQQQAMNLNNQMNGFQQNYLQNQTQQLNGLPNNTNLKQDNNTNFNQGNSITSNQQQNNSVQTSNSSSSQTKITDNLAMSSQSSNESANSNQANSQNMQDNQVSQPQQMQSQQGQNIQQNLNTPNLLSTPSIDFIQNPQLFTHPMANMVNIPSVQTPNLLTPPFIPPPATINLLNPSFDQLQKLPSNQLTKSMSYSMGSSSSQLQQQNSQQQQQNNQQSQQQQQQQQSQGSQISANAINENLRRYMGSLKFFDENKNYGFIVMDDDNKDIFVHYDDLQKAGITKEFLKSSKQGNVIRFSFSCMQYIGKYKLSKKAVELQVMPYNPALSALRRQQFSYISATPQNQSNNMNMMNNNNNNQSMNNNNNINISNSLNPPILSNNNSSIIN